MPQSRVLDFELDSKGSITSTLRQALAQMSTNPFNSALRDYVARVVEMSLRKNKMNSVDDSEARTVLDACATLARQDLFLRALHTVSRRLDERSVDAVAQQVAIGDFGTMVKS